MMSRPLNRPRYNGGSGPQGCFLAPIFGEAAIQSSALTKLNSSREAMPTTPVTAFKTIFDIANQGYTTWWFALPGLFFVYLGYLLVFRGWVPQMRMPHRPPPRGLQGRQRKAFNWFILVFSVAWVIFVLHSSYGQYRTAVAELKQGNYNVVEGPVTDFVPMAYGHKGERFTVSGQRFSYSDDIVTTGFHHAAADGGPIHEGLYVRISYVRNTILKLEVAQ
jgi:hypothetical protein